MSVKTTNKIKCKHCVLVFKYIFNLIYIFAIKCYL